MELILHAPYNYPCSKGFTLIELLVVISIIGLLSAIAIPAYSSYREGAKVSRTAAELKHVAQGFLAYSIDNEEFPPDSHQDLPDGMNSYINQAIWDAETPLGGYYNWEGPDNYEYAGVSIFNASVDEDVLVRLDRILDDGDLNKGLFRKGSNGRPTLIIHTNDS